MRVLLAIVATLFFTSGLTAEDMPTVNHSTDNKLLSEVKTRMVLENGLVIHIWEWNEKAKELGLDKHQISSTQISVLQTSTRQINIRQVSI